MTISHTPLIVGNWKMNKIGEEASILARKISNHKEKIYGEVVVCPPFIYLQEIHQVLSESTVAIGGQDCHPETSGAFTGDVSATMLADSGCRYVILGHSERRIAYGETDQMVRRKVEAAQNSGLSAIICVGESDSERRKGQTLTRISSQLQSSIPDSAIVNSTVIAYEPIWAIGTGNTPKVDEIKEVHGHIRSYLNVIRNADFASQIRILYGGSVNAGNATALLRLPNVDGVLVGGASLNAEEFLAIASSDKEE